MTRQSRVFNRVYAPKRVREGAINRRDGCSGITSIYVPRWNNGPKGILVYMWSERAAPWSGARRKPRPDRARSVSTLERNPVTGKRAAGSARATVRARARQTVLSRRKRRTRRKPEGAGSRKARRGCVPCFERVSERERWIRGCP